MKVWPIDLLVPRSLELEVPERLPQGLLACGTQAFIATFLFDPSMPALEVAKNKNNDNASSYVGSLLAG